jgi:hypothetical protein
LKSGYWRGPGKRGLRSSFFHEILFPHLFHHATRADLLRSMCLLSEISEIEKINIKKENKIK